MTTTAALPPVLAGPMSSSALFATVAETLDDGPRVDPRLLPALEALVSSNDSNDPVCLQANSSAYLVDSPSSPGKSKAPVSALQSMALAHLHDGGPKAAPFSTNASVATDCLALPRRMDVDHSFPQAPQGPDGAEVLLQVAQPAAGVGSRVAGTRRPALLLLLPASKDPDDEDENEREGSQLDASFVAGLRDHLAATLHAVVVSVQVAELPSKQETHTASDHTATDSVQQRTSEASPPVSSPLEEAAAALAWLHGQRDTRDIGKIILCGIGCAGGALACKLARYACRDAGRRAHLDAVYVWSPALAETEGDSEDEQDEQDASAKVKAPAKDTATPATTDGVTHNSGTG